MIWYTEPVIIIVPVSIDLQSCTSIHTIFFTNFQLNSVQGGLGHGGERGG